MKVSWWGKRILVSAASFVFALVALEAAFQILGAVAHAKINDRLRTTGGADRPIVAFCGDSNMFGAYLEKETQTMPAVVEELSRRGGSPGLRCYNFGVPGSPTWIVLNQVRRALELKPKIVVVRAGINNTWQLPPEKGLGILDQSKLFKLARIALFSPKVSDGMQPEGEAGTLELRHSSRLGAKLGEDETLHVRRSDGYLPFENLVDRMRSDYLEMLQLCEAAGAKLVFATYSASFGGTFASVRQEMLTFGLQHKIPVADCGSVIHGVLSDTTASAPFDIYERRIARMSTLLTRDRHPTALCYEIEARVVCAALANLGAVGKESVEPPLAPIQGIEMNPPLLRAVEDKPGLFRLFGKPGDRPQLVLGVPGQSQIKEIAIPLDWQQFKQAAGEPLYLPSAQSHREGWYEFQIPHGVLKKAPPKAAAIVVLERGGEFKAACIFLSNAVPLARK
jgi:hypothetical protein